LTSNRVRQAVGERTGLEVARVIPPAHELYIRPPPRQEAKMVRPHPEGERPDPLEHARQIPENHEGVPVTMLDLEQEAARDRLALPARPADQVAHRNRGGADDSPEDAVIHTGPPPPPGLVLADQKPAAEIPFVRGSGLDLTGLLVTGSRLSGVPEGEVAIAQMIPGRAQPGVER
jgi:hypothetical protein